MAFLNSPRSRLAALLGALIVAASAATIAIMRPPPRINVLVPDGAREFTLMDFAKSFPLDNPPPGWRHRKF